MDVLTGTQSTPPRGFAFNAGATQCVLEPAGGLSCSVTVQAGAPIERIRLVEGEPDGPWRLYQPGESFDVAEAERVLMRPRAAGGGSVTFAWHGDRLAILKDYNGRRGSRDA